MINIPFVALSKLFPKDTLWTSGCLEIIGYSAKENLHIVIEDGCCRSESGDYLVHKYKPKDPEFHKTHWNIGEYPMKYLSDEYAEKVFEGRMDFSYYYKKNLKEALTESLCKSAITIAQDPTIVSRVDRIQGLIFLALTNDHWDNIV